MPPLLLIDVLADLFKRKSWTTIFFTTIQLMVGAGLTVLYINSNWDWQFVVAWFPISTVALASVFSFVLQYTMLGAYKILYFLTLVHLGCQYTVCGLTLYHIGELLIAEKMHHPPSAVHRA